MGIPIGFPPLRNSNPRLTGKVKATWASVGPKRGERNGPVLCNDTSTCDLKFKTGSRRPSFIPIAGDRRHSSDDSISSAKSASSTRCPLVPARQSVAHRSPSDQARATLAAGNGPFHGFPALPCCRTSLGCETSNLLALPAAMGLSPSSADGAPALSSTAAG